LTGPAGNIEFLAALHFREGEPVHMDDLLEQAGMGNAAV
jgi:hypothetical protein